MISLRPWLLLLLLEESEERDTRDLDDLETNTGNVTLCLALTTETRDEDLVVLVCNDGQQKMSATLI